MQGYIVMNTKNNNNSWKLIPLEDNQKYEINFDTQEIRNIKTGKILKQVLGKSNGYYKVSLSLWQYRIKTIEVHRLVAMTFIQKPNDGKRYVVDHIDNNKLNNHPANLQYISQSENLLKSTRTLKYLKLTAEQKQEIKAMYQDGKSTIAITKHFNDMGIKVSRPTVSRTVKSK